MFDSIFPAWATKMDELDNIVNAIAAVGYPECNSEEGQDEAARSIGYRDAEDMYKILSSDEIDYINKQLRKRFI